jgi:pimeloyl-ACP methyl ester carboxylesterase
MNAQPMPDGTNALAQPPREGVVWPGCSVEGESGEPVVMLHSSLSSKSQWALLAHQLSPRFRVIAVDLWGYGENAMPAFTQRFSLDDEVRLVAAHVDRLVPAHLRVHIVGHSYGALVGLRFAQMLRGRVASLSLYEPVAFGMLANDDGPSTEVARLAHGIKRMLAADQREDAARAFIDFWNGQGAYDAMSPRSRKHAALRMDKVVLDFRAAWTWRPNPSVLHGIYAPALLLTGSRSPGAVQRIVRLLARALPDSRVATLDAGHMAPVTDAHRVNPWIEAFIDMCVEHHQSPRTRAMPALGQALAAD